MEENSDNKKVKISEKISLKLGNQWFVSKIKVFLIIAILFASYIALNLWAKQAELPEIDMTENKIYTLTDTSKNAMKSVNQDVKIYVYGFEERSSLIDLLKQYNEANEKITYEMLTEESNYEMVKKYELSEGYTVVIIKAGDSEKVIDAKASFATYDNITGQQVDTAEQTLTNSILALNQENKPKIYFTQGHGEYDYTVIGFLGTKLTNEAFELNFINLATAGSVPQDCDILAILSPASDFYDVEAQAVKDYINKGGEIYFSMDVVSQELQLPNIQSILDQYGVSIKNGYIMELAEKQALNEKPYIFMPTVSSKHEITRDIYTDSRMWLVYSGRLEYQSDETLKNLNVVKESLLTSSDKSAFITDLSADLSTATQNAQIGVSDIAAIATKTITPPEGSKDTESKLIVVASANFLSDYIVSELNKSYPLSYIDSNVDFAINSMAYLGNKENIISIRKEYTNSTYIPTPIEDIVVKAIIIAVPMLIIVIGIVIWSYRKKRK